MRDARFILILTAVAVPVAGWLTFEALVAPEQPARHGKAAEDKALLAPAPLSQPQPQPQTQAPQVVAAPPQPAAVANAAPPLPAETATAAAVRKREGKAKSSDVANNSTKSSTKHASKDANVNVPSPSAESGTPSLVKTAPTESPPPTIQAKPRSPEELCADRSNFISRNLCEARACGTAEWSAHPSCVKRRELEERNRPGSIMGGGG